MKSKYTILLLVCLPFFALGQAMYSVPTVITVENSAYTAPVFKANLAITLLEDFGNPRRPVQTEVGEYQTDNKGNVVVSLMPNKDYSIVAEVDGFYTQISKINTKGFSRTKVNKKGISLRPRFLHAIQGQIKMGSSIRLDGLVMCKNVYSDHVETYSIDKDGGFFIKAVSGYDYEVRIVVDGILDTTIIYQKGDLIASTVEEPKTLSIDVDYDFPNHAKGSVLSLANTGYKGRTTALQSKIWVDTLADILTKFPRVRIKLNIYTDARKSDRKNYQLAKARAVELSQLLKKKHILGEQYLIEPMGEQKMLNECVDGVRCSIEQHEINNRIELIVMSGRFYWSPTN